MEYAWLCPRFIGKKKDWETLLLSLKDGIYFGAPHPFVEKINP